MRHSVRPDLSEAMPLDAALRDKIARFSVRPAGGDIAPPIVDEVLVFADIADSREKAFGIAAGLLERGKTVRVIGPAVTLARTWPAWVRASAGLTLTEWGAFRVGAEREATQPMQDELRAWIRGVFGDDYGSVAPERVYFTAACERFFQEVVTAYPIARAIADVFPRATVHLVGPHGRTAALLQQFIGRTGGAVVGVTSRTLPRVAWRIQVACLGLAGATVAVSRVTRAYLRARPSFRALRERRLRAPMPRPETWVGVVPDWYRINHHLLDAFALPETDGGGPLGVLFVGSLDPSRRDEANPALHHASDLWPGLGQLGARLDQCQVEQAVMPEAPIDFARAAAVGLRRSARALWRLSACPEIRLPSVRFAVPASDVVRWATLDALRATLSEAAARALFERNSMAGTTVIFVASNTVTWSSVDLMLRAAGATTVDHPHGAGGDLWSAASDGESSFRLVWTLPDARSAAAPGVRTLLTGMPLRFDLPPRTAPPRRVLVITGFVHRDDFMPGDNPFPREVYQPELLDVIRRLRALGHADLEFRWRPHPADVLARVLRDLGDTTDVELSRGRPLEEDAAWADVIVSSNSTAVIEMMFAGVPVFLHNLAEFDGLPATSFLARERVFFHAEDGARRVAAWLDRFASRPSDGLAPERAARVALFGAAGVPVPMTEYFGRRRTRPIPWLAAGRGAPDGEFSAANCAAPITPDGGPAQGARAPPLPRTG